MISNPPDVWLSATDEKRFGIRIARANLRKENFFSALDFCHANGVALLIARTPTSELQLVQSMEREGFFLTDTLVYYKRDLQDAQIPRDTGSVSIRPLRAAEAAELEKVASLAFHGYFGHYHADRRLDGAKCDEVYTSWASLSCTSRDVADAVLVADAGGSIGGFATLRLNSAEEGEGVLFGVHPSFQGQGLYRSMMIHGMKWCLEQGAKQMVVSTQITNVAVQKVWSRLGFEPCRAYYTFHKWFDIHDTPPKHS